MRSKALLCGLLLGTACSSATLAGDSGEGTNEIISTDGPLRLTVTDAPTAMGIMFARPVASVTGSGVTVANTRYGSECVYAVTGHADVGANTITLRIAYAERLALCTAEVRALTYRAEVNGLSQKAYDLQVIHEESGRMDTVLVQHIVLH
jgi:hypothetical protein